MSRVNMDRVGMERVGMGRVDMDSGWSNGGGAATVRHGGIEVLAGKLREKAGTAARRRGTRGPRLRRRYATLSVGGAYCTAGR